MITEVEYVLIPERSRMMTNIALTPTRSKAAQEYFNRGWQPIPVPPREKAPVLKGWQNRRFTSDELDEYFRGDGNVGIILGKPSGGLIDIDIDCSEALAVSSDFLPVTDLVHGRASKPRSHLWYIADPIPKTEKFTAPDGSCLLELRSDGTQTIVPPSTHPSGEVFQWATDGDPTKIDANTLRNAAATLATCALLARYWPEQGSRSRHQAALAAGGFLLRGGLPEEMALRVVEAAARIAGDEEWQKRGNDVRGTVRRLEGDLAMVGGPTLRQLLQNGDAVVEKITSWLGLQNTRVSSDWEQPIPFAEHTGPPFPIHALPEPVKVYVEAQAVALQVPVDLIACLAIGVGSAAAAGRCNIRLNAEWQEPLNLFVVTALSSGERKSPAFRSVTAPLEERGRELFEATKVDIAYQKAERDVLESQLHDTKAKAAKVTGASRDTLMNEIASLVRDLANINIQRSPRLLADDATSESVASLLAEQKGRIAIMSTEGGLFETMAGRYSDGVSNIDVFLKGYSGDPLRVDRKSRPSEFVRNPALTLCLTVQPGVIQGLASKRGFRARGLLARLLYSIPHSMVGYRSNIAPPVPDASRQQWRRIVMDILKQPDSSEGEEHAICLAEDAQAVFQNFRDKVEIQLRPEGDLADIADWGNKLTGAVARLAGILHLFIHAGKTTPWDIPIAVSTIEGAITLGAYFSEHAMVAFNLMGADPEIERARRLWAIIQHGQFYSFSQRDLYLRVRRSFEVDELHTTLEKLVGMGYLRLSYNFSVKKVGRPASPIFEVNPLVCTQNTQNTQNTISSSDSEDSEDSVYAGEDLDWGEV